MPLTTARVLRVLALFTLSTSMLVAAASCNDHRLSSFRSLVVKVPTDNVVVSERPLSPFGVAIFRLLLVHSICRFKP